MPDPKHNDAAEAPEDSPGGQAPARQTDEAQALTMAEKRQKRLEFARKRMLDPGTDPPLFPRGLMVLPWILLVIVMPLAIGVGAPLWADSVRRSERRDRRARRNTMKAKRQVKLDAQVNVDRALELGRGHYDDRDFRSAVEELSTYLASHPKHEQALRLRALSYYRILDLDAAKADFEKLIVLAPAYPDYYRCRGQIRGLQGDRLGAIADFEQWHELDPSRPYAALWISGLGGGNENLTPFASGTQWINEVARYYRGRMTADELLVRANQAGDEAERQDQLCEAYCYIGLRLELEGDRNMAMRRYRECVATGVTNFIEYRWASIRLNQEGRRIPSGELDLERD